jgi:preprotein translocase subunit SecY
MDDIEALRRTVRRVGAVVVVALALIGTEVAEFGALWAVVVGGGAVLYLLVSVAVGFLNGVDPIEEPAEQQVDD